MDIQWQTFKFLQKYEIVLKLLFVIVQKIIRIAGEDIDYMLNNLIKTCLEVFDRFSPLRKISKRYQKTWITADIIKLCKKRDSLHTKMV